MKKIILLFLSALVLTTFNSCNQNDPSPDTDKESTEQETDDTKDNTQDETEDNTIDPLHSTTVTICSTSSKSEAAEVVEIKIYNASQVQVGNGSSVGEYLVPYNGSITISYNIDKKRNVNYSWYKHPLPSPQSDTYTVGTILKMKIVLYAEWDNDNGRWELYSKIEQ